MRWIRRKVAWIAGAAIGGFILWLVGTVVSLQATRAEAAGTLFGKPVSFQAYQGALEAVTHEALLTHGDKFRQEVKQEELQNRAWERLLLTAEAKRIKIRVSDEEVAEYLQKWPLFQREGRFDLGEYRAILQYSLGTTPHLFEEEVRQAMTIRKLFDQAMGTITVTETEIRDRFRRQEEAIQVSALSLPGEPLAREVMDAARQEPKRLAKIAKQLKLKLTRTKLFKRADAIPELEGISGDTLEPAFAVEEGGIAGPISGSGKWLVVRVEDKRLPDEEKFYEVRETLERQLLSSKRLMSSLNWYQQLLKRADLKKNAGGKD